jgi:D-aminoacyl-tRNA deacylase
LILLVSCLVDPASVRITEELRRLGPWREAGEFDGSPSYRWRDRLLVTIGDMHLYRDRLDREVSDSLEAEPEAVVYLSRHRAASGVASLTVHPLGNYFAADYGGSPQTLVPPAPGLMTSALRELREAARDLEYHVTFEATHHGPYLDTPTFYIEVGSDESRWEDRDAAKAVATAVTRMEDRAHPVAIGVGGGHYVPRITDVALDKKIAFGHIIPKYALERDWEAAARLAADATPGATLVYLHGKGIPGPLRGPLREWFEDRGIRPVRGEDLPALVPAD